MKNIFLIFTFRLHQNTFAKKNGFTLIELLAVLGVFAIVSSIVASITVTVLRGNNKTNTINIVRSNGDYAISQMTKMLRNATSILNPYPCGTIDNPTVVSSVQLAFPDGSTTTLSCLDADNNPSITSSSASLTPTPIPLIDPTTVAVASCQFTCSQAGPSDYPVIGIDFSLNANTTSTFTEQQASASAIEFQTSVALRNLIR